jgi:hypothetical protein
MVLDPLLQLCSVPSHSSHQLRLPSGVQGSSCTRRRELGCVWPVASHPKHVGASGNQYWKRPALAKGRGCQAASSWLAGPLEGWHGWAGRASLSLRRLSSLRQGGGGRAKRSMISANALRLDHHGNDSRCLFGTAKDRTRLPPQMTSSGATKSQRNQSLNNHTHGCYIRDPKSPPRRAANARSAML